MAGTFDPKIGKPELDAAEPLQDFAVTIVSIDPVLAVLSLRSINGVRRDIMLRAQEATELADSMEGIATMTVDHPQVQAYLRAQDEAIIPYAPN